MSIPRHCIENLPVITSLLPWQELGLSKTVSGYGTKVETTKKVLFKNIWRRIYCDVISNNNSCYFFVMGIKNYVY